MRSYVSFPALEDLLCRKWFVLRRYPASHLVFENSENDVIFMLPYEFPDNIVPLPHLAGIRKMLDERGIMSREKFDAWVRKQGEGTATSAHGRS